MTTTAIHTALNVLYADQNIGETAEHESILTGEVKPVRVVIDRADTSFEASGIAVVVNSRVLNVRQSEVATVCRGDCFRILGGAETQLAGYTFEVVGEPELDGVSREWTVQVREASYDRLDT